MKSIYSLIHSNIKKALILSSASTALALAIYSYFSFLDIEHSASNFVSNHAAKLAEAGVHSQNISDIDREINRFVEAWKETQDFDLRIDLYLDGRLIGHAGQLQAFYFLSSQTENEIRLSSGKTLRTIVQIDLRRFLLIGSIQLLIFELFILLVFFALMRSTKRAIRSITTPIESRISWLKDVTQRLPESARNPPKFPKDEIIEIADLGSSVESLLKQIVWLEEHLAHVNFDRGRVKMADQVAHNIRGAIGTIQLRVSALSGISDADKQEIIESVNSIRNVSQNLLKMKKADLGDVKVTKITENFLAPVHIMPLVDSAFEAKAQQYRDQKNIFFDLPRSLNLYGAFSKISGDDLRIVLSNIVDNAKDAIPGRGIVTLETGVSSDYIEISIKDNGKGIPAHILPLVSTDGFTFGKDAGNGIGLTHAREMVQIWGGRIQIQSSEQVGTTVTVFLPRSEPPESFVRKIALNKGSRLIVTDDDPLVPATIKSRLKAAGLEEIQVEHISSPKHFDEWFSVNGYGEFGSRQYLFDFDLNCPEANGLDLVEKHGLAMESLLVSGLAEDELVMKRASKLGVRCLSKDYLAVVPFVESPVRQEVLSEAFVSK